MVNKQQLFDITKQILEDIELVIHFNSSGSFFLPEDSGGDMTYRFFGQDLIVEFEWEETETLEENIVLGDYYNDENTIKIQLLSSKPVDFYTISNIGEVLTHELTHWLQEMGGIEFGDTENVHTENYYFIYGNYSNISKYRISFSLEELSIPLVFSFIIQYTKLAATPLEASRGT